MSSVIESREVRRNGITFTVTLHEDVDASPLDYMNEGEDGCYSTEDIAAWRNDEWRYVGVVVKTTTSEASVWGVEYGRLGDTYITLDKIIESHVDDLLAEAYNS